MNYKPVIGLEVHIELKTKSKMFCACSANYFGKKPNTHTCPVCLGLPGALPVPNKLAIEWCQKIGLSLNCQINEFSKFDRKNYFYPDLPKGYQISQYDIPFCKQGEIILGNSKKIGITRVHMEEDTGKLLHLHNLTLIDFNRSGVPLVEIVTEPDFESAEEVTQYLKKLQQIVRYLEVSDADMEKGDMRLEPNISLRKANDNSLPKYKVEVKNINSFKFVEKAINYEIKRQTEILNEGNVPVQETRGWDEKKQITLIQRQKEEAHDYRYFPEPDIPPFRFDNDYVNNLKKNLPELPDVKILRFQKDYALPYYDCEILTRSTEIAQYFEKCVNLAGDKVSTKQIANYLINKRVDFATTPPEKIIETMQKEKPEEIDQKELAKILDQVIINNEKAVSDLKSGKQEALMFLIGQVLKTAGKKIDTQLIKERLKEKIK